MSETAAHNKSQTPFPLHRLFHIPSSISESLTAEDLSGTPSDAELSAPVRTAVTLTVYIFRFPLIITGIEHTALFLSAPEVTVAAVFRLILGILSICHTSLLPQISISFFFGVRPGFFSNPEHSFCLFPSSDNTERLSLFLSCILSRDFSSIRLSYFSASSKILSFAS